MNTAKTRSGIEQNSSERSGSALLMLVITLAMLISVFSATLVRQSNLDFRVEREREAITLLENAISAVHEINPSDVTNFKLPIDASKNDWIEITRVLNDDNVQELYLGTLIHNGNELLTIQRMQQPPE
jgi:hypothetical protein